MIEEEFTLSTDDGFKIYGMINKKEGNKKAIIICHGLSENMNNHHFQEAKRFFPEKGYDVIRFDFYSYPEDSRKLKDTTVAIHVKDFNKVLEKYRSLYDSIYAVGDSYGGLTLVVANPSEIDAVSLWDGSYDTSNWEEYLIHVQELDMYVFKDDPVGALISKAMYEENLTFRGENMAKIASEFKAPVQVISAGGNLDWVIKTQEDQYKTLGSEKKEYCVIDGADHFFSNKSTVFDLLENTYRWFEEN